MHYTLKIQEQTISESMKLFSAPKANPLSPTSVSILSEEFFRNPMQLFESSSSYNKCRNEIINANHSSHEADEMISNMLQSHIALIPHEERCIHLTSVLCTAVAREEREKEEIKTFVQKIIDSCRLKKRRLSSADADELSTSTMQKLNEVQKCLEVLGKKSGLVDTNDIVRSVTRFTKVTSYTQRQSDFEKIIIDNRTHTGQIFSLFVNFFKIESQSIDIKRIPPPNALFAFSQYFSSKVVEEYDLAVDLVPALHVYIEHALFFKLHDQFNIYSFEEVLKLDEHWMVQKKWLQEMSQKQIGICDKYICKVENKRMLGDELIDSDEIINPYFASSMCLNELLKCKTPTDMFQVILRLVKVMSLEAAACAGETDEKSIQNGFDAETFFPILVYSLLHSDIDNIYYCLSFMYNFGDPIKNVSGEVAYYLCSLGAAVNWICDQRYDSLDELEDWSPKKRRTSLDNSFDDTSSPILVNELYDGHGHDTTSADNRILKAEILDFEKHKV